MSLVGSRGREREEVERERERERERSDIDSCSCDCSAPLSSHRLPYPERRSLFAASESGKLHNLHHSFHLHPTIFRTCVRQHYASLLGRPHSRVRLTDSVIWTAHDSLCATLDRLWEEYVYSYPLFPLDLSSNYITFTPPLSVAVSFAQLVFEPPTHLLESVNAKQFRGLLGTSLRLPQVSTIFSTSFYLSAWSSASLS